MRVCAHTRALALWHLCYIINLKGLDNKLQVHGRQAPGAVVVVVAVAVECMRGRVKDCVQMWGLTSGWMGVPAVSLTYY